MTLVTVTVPCILLLLAISGYDCSDQDALVRQFNREAIRYLPQRDFDRLFTPNYKNQNELVEATDKGIQEFSRVYGEPFPDDLFQKIHDTTKNAKRLSPKVYFRTFAYAIARTLAKNGILTSITVEYLASYYASLLSKTAESLQSYEYIKTLPAIGRATADFLKVLYPPPSEDKLVEYQNILLDEEKKALNG